VFDTSRHITVKAAFDLVLEVIDYDLFDAALDCAIVGFKVRFAAEERFQHFAEGLVDVARAMEAAYFGLFSYFHWASRRILPPG